MRITKPGDIAYAPLKSLDSTTPFKQYVIPQEVYQNRLAALRACMQAEKLDAVAIYADREHFWNFKYFLGYDPRFEEALLIVTKSDPSTVLLGNECLSLAKLSPIPVNGVMAQEFSLPNQPMDQHVPLVDLLRAAGIEKGAHVGVIGWKMFTRERGQVLRSQICVPNFIVEGLRAAAEGGSLENVSDILIHPDYGIRTVNDVHTIAAMEYGAWIAKGMGPALSAGGVNDKKRGDEMSPRFIHRCLFLFEHVLPDAANWADEVLGNVLPLRAGSKAVIGIALRLVIGPAAYGANILLHEKNPPLSVFAIIQHLPAVRPYRNAWLKKLFI